MLLFLLCKALLDHWEFALYKYCILLLLLLIEDNELIKLSFNSNLSCLCSKNTVNAILEDLPMLQTISNIGNIPHFSNFDPKCNTPSKVNFNYFDLHKFHRSPEINTCSNKALSLLNCNIRSIQANFDNLVQLLNDLNYPFNIISLSETWLRSNEQISNLDLPGYSFLSQLTTQRAGGVGLYIRNGMVFNLVLDMTLPLALVKVKCYGLKLRVI